MVLIAGYELIVGVPEARTWEVSRPNVNQFVVTGWLAGPEKLGNGAELLCNPGLLDACTALTNATVPIEWTELTC